MQIENKNLTPITVSSGRFANGLPYVTLHMEFVEDGGIVRDAIIPPAQALKLAKKMLAMAQLLTT